MATAPKVAAMRVMLERCQEAAAALAGQLATRDTTIRQQRDHIAHLEEELARLRVP